MASTDIAKVITLGRGGWVAYLSTHSRISGYGDDWRKYADPAALVIDSTTIDEDAIGVYAYQGPMLDPDLAPGTVNHCFGRTEAWKVEGRYETPEIADAFDGDFVATIVANYGLTTAFVGGDGRDGRLGNAGGMDYVSPDVQALICASFGGTVTTCGEAMAAAAGRAA